MSRPKHPSPRLTRHLRRLERELHLLVRLHPSWVESIAALTHSFVVRQVPAMDRRAVRR